MYITILCSRSKAHSIWMESHTMHSTEMSFYGGKILIVYYIKKFHFKTTFLRSSCCHIFCILATTKEHMELLIFFTFVQWTDLCISAGECVIKTPNFIECLWVQELTSSIFTGSEEHRKIMCDCNCENFTFVNIFDLDHSFFFNVIMEKSSTICAIID